MSCYYKQFIAIIFTTFILSGCGSSDTKKSTDSNLSMNILLGNKVREYHLPAMGLIVVDQNNTLYKESVGLQKYNSQATVTNNDLWSIGSITKSMTATLSAILVKQGVLTWQTTVADVYPEFLEDMQDQYKIVTLQELLSHTSGLPVDDDSTWQDFANLSDPVTDQRYAFTYEVLSYPSDGVSGEYNYSNINYVVASAMLEKLTDTSYEDLIKTYLFDQLDMNSTQVDVNDLENGIWGHKEINGSWQEQDPLLLNADNASIVAAAGSRTFVSLDDIAKYLQFHLQLKMENDNSLLDHTDAQTLYTSKAVLSEEIGYAMGWFTQVPNTIQHSGSNGRWFALSVVDAQSGYAYFVVTNAYKPGTEEAVYEMMDLVIEKTQQSI